MRGGYQILDLSGISFTSGSEQTVKGAYSVVESSHKAILIEGLTVDDTEYKPLYCPLIVSGADYTATVGEITVKITQEDAVTITKGE